MKWNFLIISIMFIMFLPIVLSYEKIIQFDDNEDIIISTTVYNTSGQRCIDCSCNLTIYNPFPNDNETNQAHWMGEQRQRDLLNELIGEWDGPSVQSQHLSNLNRL